MPLNTDILDLVQQGAAKVNPTSSISQATANATTSAIQGIKDKIGIAGTTTTSNDPFVQNTTRGKHQAAINEISSPRATMTSAEVKEQIADREKLIASYNKEIEAIDAGNTSGLDGIVSPGIGVGDTETYESQARKTYLEGRVADLESQRDSYRALDTGSDAARTSQMAQWDRDLYADQIKDRERTAAGVENLADQLGTFQAHTDNLMGDSTNLAGLSKAANVIGTVADVSRDCGDLLGMVGGLTGGADVINGALGALGDLGDILEDVNSVLIKVNQTKAQLEGLINDDNLKLDTVITGAKSAMEAAVLSEINRDPCAAYLFNNVLGSPQLKDLL